MKLLEEKKNDAEYFFIRRNLISDLDALASVSVEAHRSKASADENGSTEIEAK